jgi:ADP-ribosylglycohydrolase
MKNLLLSAAIGDIAGSAYEGHGHRIKDYNKVKMFSSRAHFTDDTVLTFACAEAFIENLDMAMNMWKCANEHRHAGFGSKFKLWMANHYPKPYRSLGNGSAMRCSSAGWLAKTEEECIKLATETAAPTHNHPEGIKGAQATALCIFMARQGASKEEIRKEIEGTFGYNLRFTCDEIRPSYTWGGTCQDSVPQAIVSFLDGNDFEDSIKNAISIGGDSDTIGCITGSIAEAFFGVPVELRERAMSYLPKGFKAIITEFENKYGHR